MKCAFTGCANPALVVTDPCSVCERGVHHLCFNDLYNPGNIYTSNAKDHGNRSWVSSRWQCGACKESEAPTTIPTYWSCLPRSATTAANAVVSVEPDAKLLFRLHCLLADE
ncbi:hypothetical protein GQ600_10769 [Phytophthora cactorum]|nr:hypothetical protein GQ600_10769 [Phytophthora cactorum]